MTRILYITNGIKGAGGLERVLSIKASYLAEKLNYQVHILVLNHHDAPLFYSFSQKIHLHDLVVKGNPVNYLFSYIQGVRRLVKEIDPAIISVCDDGLKGFFLPIILGKRCPMIYERHVSKIVLLGPSPGLLKRALVQLKFLTMQVLGRYFDRFIVLTQDNTAEWNLPNLLVIPNPLSFYPEESAQLEQPVVIAVGKQSYQKGFDQLLTMWKEVVKQFPNYQLHIYGKKDPKQRLPELANQLGLQDTVQFFDPVADIHQKYLSSSVFVLPSRYEGFGMVLIEAMACGVPCVSFACPCGPADIITHGEDGYLVPNGDQTAFTNNLLSLLADQTLRKEFGQRAKIHVKRFLPEHIMPIWDRLFKSMLS